MATLTVGAFGLDIDEIDLSLLLDSTVVTATSTTYRVQLDTGEIITFFGTGFTYDPATGVPSGGTVTRIAETYLGITAYDLSGISVPAQSLLTWALTGDNATAVRTVLAGADSMSGSATADLLRGYDGNDYIMGYAGNDGLDAGTGDDTVYGGLGDDIIVARGAATATGTWLRGDEGDDIIQGGAGFDNIQGNMGNDSEAGGLGNDWVVGGKDNDLLYGEDGDDVINGNLGDDVCFGSIGADIVRGGQGADSISGEAGNDWISGDLGDDTISGGAGADTFHGMANIGIDRITDFHISEGDKVILDPGVAFTVAQVGADTIVTVAGGQMILVGVTLSTLPSGWIVGG